MKTETEVVQQKTPAAKLIDRLDELAQSGNYGEVALCTSKGRIFSWQKHRLENLQDVFINSGDVYGFVCVSEDEIDNVLSTVWVEEDELGIEKFEYTQALLNSVACVWLAWKDDHRAEDILLNLQWQFCPKCGDVINEPDDF
jgi:hypothetical protein